MASTRDTGEMVNGKKHGYWITYFANGQKRSEGNFIHGKMDSISQEWKYIQRSILP